ncbi:hypothetical protein HPMG_00084 [Helicobacter pullorum MIT 98-5489]|uniref:Uncharacterized protein n=2 Tax=Helicobacter pullorum TaxID=35818 RepID=C5EX83_9HELI|nr:hypothetical protein HPMG_00084 [Helicobacter pullorum MIT 98-5489]
MAKMTNAIMLQAQNSFTLTDEMMNSLKELFGEKINVVELDNDMIEALQSDLSQTDNIRLKNIVNKLENKELKLYSELEFAKELKQKGYQW